MQKKQGIRRQVFGIFIALAIAISGGGTAWATGWNDFTISGAPGTDYTLVTAGAVPNDTLNVTAGKTVTVTGTVDAANALSIFIPASSKVIWKATLTVSRPNFNSNGTVIGLSGDGDFEVTEDGTISVEVDPSYSINAVLYANDSVSVTVSGGTVSVSGDTGYAITTTAGDVKVSGGMVSASGEKSVVIAGADPAGSIEIKNAVLIMSGAGAVTEGSATATIISAFEFVNGIGAVTGTPDATLTQDLTLSGDLTIPAGAKLTIAPGVTLNLNSHKLTNNGTIVNNGTIEGEVTGNEVIGNQPLPPDIPDTPDIPDRTPNRHSGGCDAGFGAAALVAALTALTALIRRK